jgi:TolB-like protein
MNYKFIVLMLISLFSAGNLFPAEKWNVLIASWGDQSLKPDKNAGLILQKSISSRLSREDNFNIVAGLPARTPVTGYQEAISQGREAKADVIVFGSYFIERDKLYVTAEVYDVLENRLKMRRVYTGAVTIDIFDTADSMASDIVDKIKEALPAMTEENETKVKKIRQTLYETEKINIKRQLYSRFGLMTDIGSKDLNGFSGAWPLTMLDIGFAFRYWDIRLDFNILGLQGLPFYDWTSGYIGLSRQVPSIISIGASYYLPWWGEKLALGIGFLSQNDFVATNLIENNQAQFYGSRGAAFFNIYIIWNPMPELELNLMFTPLFNSINIPAGGGTISYETYPFTIGAVYFLGDIGLSARFSYSRGNFNETDINSQTINSTFQDIMISVGLVYRVDFL